ncbi:hypothetical protein ACH33A_26205, partial [Escherichia coli]|uniref:hypothetical protein n=1 Tax=Escherichia coli TaxID=562 RepID=UPI00378B484A
TIAQIKGLVISQALTGIISMRFLMCTSNGVCILPVNRSITTLYSGGRRYGNNSRAPDTVVCRVTKKLAEKKQSSAGKFQLLTVVKIYIHLLQWIYRVAG